MLIITAPKPNKQEKKAFAVLNHLISKRDIGKMVPDRLNLASQHPIHLNNEEIIKASYVPEYSTRRRFAQTIRHQDYLKHINGLETFYFTAGQEDGCLLMIDIDCHKNKGSAEGALKFADWIKSNIFSGAYFEPSTGLIGQHGYIIIERHGMSQSEVCDWAKKLELYLKQYAHRFDVSDIEVKGLPHVPIFEGRRLVKIKFGQLAKVPRHFADRFEEFRNTTIVDPKTFTFMDFGNEKKPVEKVGSNCVELGNLKRYDAAADYFMGGESKIKVNSNVAILRRDMSFVLAMTYYCTKVKPNADGSMPTERLKAIWDQYYQEGYIDRAWSWSRFAAIRDLIDQYDGINWRCHLYSIGGAGQHNGKACKWVLTESLCRLIEVLTSGIDVERETFTIGTLALEAIGYKNWITKPEIYWPTQDIPSDEEVEALFYKLAA